MSRTNKDKPAWVTAEWYEPFHTCGWYRVPKWRKVKRKSDFGFTYDDIERAGFKWEYRGDCDLPAEPVRRGGRYWWKRSGATCCIWKAAWPRERYFNTRGAKKTANCHYEFHGPQRAAVRAACRKAVQGDVEVEFPDGRTRSSVRWDMW